jgi:peptidoglycan hydrolase CwlO-like protein
MKIVKDLLLALVNATVLLLIILAVLVLMVLNRTDRLAHEVIDGVTPVAEDIDRLADAVAGIESELDSRPVGEEADALATEIAALREEIEALRPGIEALGALSAEVILRGLMARFTAAPAE